MRRLLFIPAILTLYALISFALLNVPVEIQRSVGKRYQPRDPFFLNGQSLLLLGAGGAGAAGGPPVITYITGCTNNASAALTTNCAVSVNAGDMMILSSRVGNTSGNPTLAVTSTSTSTGWQHASTISNIGTGNAFNAQAFTYIAPTTQSETVTVTWSAGNGNNCNLAVGVYRSNQTFLTQGVDRQTQSQVTASQSTCPTGTTTTTQNPNDLVIAICQTTNGSQTWGALSGYTKESSSSRNTPGAVGWYDAVVTTTGTQTAAIPFSPNTTGTGFIIAIHASNVLDATNATNVGTAVDSSQSTTFDHVTKSGVIAGNLLVYWVTHSNATGTGTITMSDSQGNVWWACDANTAGGTSITVNDNHTYAAGANAAACFYSWATVGGTVVGQPTATDCASNCTFVASSLNEFSDALIWDAGAYGSGTSSAGASNNMSCGAVTTAAVNDFVVCSLRPSAGTGSAGTSPITFTIFNAFTTSNGVGEWAVWTGSGSITPAETVSGGSGRTYGGFTVAFK